MRSAEAGATSENDCDASFAVSHGNARDETDKTWFFLSIRLLQRHHDDSMQAKAFSSCKDAISALEAKTQTRATEMDHVSLICALPPINKSNTFFGCAIDFRNHFLFSGQCSECSHTMPVR